jgi:hypothetical protein
MKRLMILTVLLVLLMSLVMTSPHASREVKAGDPCTDCLMWVEAHFEECEAIHGQSQFCYDQFNSDIVYCYAHYCEQ